MYALCVAGAVNTQGFVWKFFLSAIYKFSFIHSFTPSLSPLSVLCVYMCVCGSSSFSVIIICNSVYIFTFNCYV